MCTASFERAIVTAYQFLHYNNIEAAKISLTFAKRYADTPAHNIIIAQLDRLVTSASRTPLSGPEIF